MNITKQFLQLPFGEKRLNMVCLNFKLVYEYGMLQTESSFFIIMTLRTTSLTKRYHQSAYVRQGLV
jgi:hypothetical protein